MIYFVFLCLLSCSDYAIKNDMRTGPELVVYPDNINFGNLISGQETGESSFAIINAGDENLLITKPELTPGIKFSLDNNLHEEYTIAPGDSVNFNIYYDPTTYESNVSYVLFSSNDEDKPYYELQVQGEGDAPLVSITPANLDFGDISLGCNVQETITIRNNGNLNLLIENITQMTTPPADILLNFGSLHLPPWEIEPGEEIDFLIEYSPSDVNLDQSELLIESNDPVNENITVSQTGNGDIIHWYSESYRQNEERLVDIVFVVDNSGSMSQHQNSLALQMNDFISILINSDVDYHIGFITTDSHLLVSFDGYAWIDSRHPDPGHWMMNVINMIGTSGSAYEKGIYYAYLFSDTQSINGSGYWRETANYVIVYISDEPDHSPNLYTSYYSFFDTIKSNSNLMHQYAVIGDYPAGCTMVFPQHGVSYQIGFGLGYYEMTQRYNGHAYSICSPDWGNQMQDLAADVSVQSTFVLNQTDIIEDTISVIVNGQASNEWYYDSQLNAVVFNEGYAPDPGNSIDINYAISGC